MTKMEMAERVKELTEYGFHLGDWLYVTKPGEIPGCAESYEEAKAGDRIPIGRIGFDYDLLVQNAMHGTAYVYEPPPTCEAPDFKADAILRLEDLLQTAGSRFEGTKLTYWRNDCGDEKVRIEYPGGDIREVDVSGDSIVAMWRDVLGRL